MKELSVEQKAKRYDEVIELVNSKWHYRNQPCIIDVSEIFPELAESEDEKIRKELICFLETEIPQCAARDKYIAWLEKQGEHQKFRDSIQIGDNVTRNEDGMLVNLSQLKRVAKPAKKQGVQKPATWSEEDEKMIQDIINDIAIAQEQVYCKSRCEDEINWLKSLRPQNRWKPSGEQMEALEHFIVYHNGSTNYAKDLEELRLQLKKLKE